MSMKGFRYHSFTMFITIQLSRHRALICLFVTLTAHLGSWLFRYRARHIPDVLNLDIHGMSKLIFDHVLLC